MHQIKIEDIIRQGIKTGLQVSAKRASRIVPLTENLASWLDEYLQMRRKVLRRKIKPTDFVFVSLSNNSKNKQLSRLWVQDREEVLKNDDGVQWRGGKRPNYSMTNAHRSKEKKYRYESGSLEAIAYNLVRTFEMEASFKTNPQQWISVVVDRFRMSTNGEKEYTLQEVIDSGTYNLFLEDSEHYRASDETFKSSYELFHNAFPNGFHWELAEVVARTPNVVFKWRHWGTFTGEYKGHQPTGETIEVTGLSIARVRDDLKIESVEHFSSNAKKLVFQ